MTRHLVFEIKVPDGAMTGCGEASRIPFDEEVHTMLTKLSGCSACLAVHAAWMVLTAAEEGLR